jgi:hypothetical protein
MDCQPVSDFGLRISELRDSIIEGLYGVSFDKLRTGREWRKGEKGKIISDFGL